VSSAAVVRLPTGPAREVILLKRALREATQLGAQFRIAGADVAIDGADKLPSPLRDSLIRFTECGLLRSYLGGDEPDEEALDLLDTLDVDAVLVETCEALRAAIRQLEVDKRANGGTVGIDIETAPQPGQGTPRPWVSINIDGARSAVRPKWEDRTGLDPHRANIATVQLYAGGVECFVCRGEALDILLHSHWLRRQCLIAHNASFEAIFLRRHSRYTLPPGRRSQFRLDCSMQAAGLLIGVAKRSLANTAQTRSGLNVPKELQTSDWAAKRLSDGQIAYAASDAILAWRLWPDLLVELHQKGRWEAYELQRRAIPAVVDMRLSGLGIDREEHARQSDEWARDLAEARHAYHAITGNPPPSKPAEVREWLATVLDPARLAVWPRTPTGELTIEATYLTRPSRNQTG
jgi:ribonuclease D